MCSDAASIIAQALGVPPEGVTKQTSLMTSAAWDSLAHFRIVMSLENRLGRALNPLEVTTLIDLASVAALLVND